MHWCSGLHVYVYKYCRLLAGAVMAHAHAYGIFGDCQLMSMADGGMPTYVCAPS